MSNLNDLGATVSGAVARYKMTAVVRGEFVAVVDNKGRTAATVALDGRIDRKYAGAQALCGALVRDAISAAIRQMA